MGVLKWQNKLKSARYDELIQKGLVNIRVQRARLWSTPEGWLRVMTHKIVFRCQVSATECDPPCRRRSWNGFVLTAADFHQAGDTQPKRLWYSRIFAIYLNGFPDPVWNWNLKPETWNSVDLWQSQLSLTPDGGIFDWTWGPGFPFWINYLILFHFFVSPAVPPFPYVWMIYPHRCTQYILRKSICSCPQINPYKVSVFHSKLVEDIWNL